MPGLSDILTTVQQGVVATNILVTQLSGSMLNISGQLTALSSQINRTPTVQTLTSGSSSTYTPTSTAVKWIEVLMVGGGGGGAGVTNGTSIAVAGSSGGATLFSSWAANGGSGCTGSGTTGASYGTGGTGGVGTATRRIAGQNGAATTIVTAFYTPTIWGGDSELGRGAGASRGSAPQGGQAAAANTGGGGSGSFAGAVSFVQGGGGAGGEFAYLLITVPSSSYLYTIGSGGAGGAGANATGGTGGSGVVYIVEHYGT